MASAVGATVGCDTLDGKGKYTENLKQEVQSIEKELKDWFITRKLAAQRAEGIRKKLAAHNMTGFSVNNPNLPLPDRVMWSDLVAGKPDLEDSLSKDAKLRKAERYLSMFEGATEVGDLCRLPGVKYLRCLADNHTMESQERSSTCLTAFSAFNSCRKGLQMQQAANIENAVIKQDTADNRAKALFTRRSLLLDNLGGPEMP
uniref:Uncharacterized protein n=1 Tax=Chromera velia CCMP2878 TaxID=1169474 RepID=A0A0G4ICW3_9ALVE|mmetsp:Transcript_7165/g.14060  ORF Transcript_7165/g.14060 Transcript_7165/m.14060 type:complete len:202 (-) Transcript_7165:497-1102(-)|eukprot:Cvel_2302.t1-p1 / transcript=Cvel_2302.t1 / gene=Cvel_2302 / organism=Chromera_velia_CCMP2878 / gene_product=hypothetical protein / transcript_product=hypothetical protein / location=Cvel_scaffold89:20616-24259(-) / protein_length=201 / sequence_SO=supercontig / SO=protein_coding / is_pseudo=false